MSGIKILHAADLHLDSPFEGLPDAKAAQRRAEQRQLLMRIAQTANSEHVKLALFSGDLLDTGSAYMETGESLIGALGSIDAPVFIAPGNHDWYSPRSPYARLKWPENVTIFSHPHIECAALPDEKLRVWGAGFTDSSCPGLLEGFEAEKEPETIDIMYLAVRLAVCRLALPEEDKCPIILDDPLVNFDAEREKQAIKLLEEIAKERQVILFSCRNAASAAKPAWWPVRMARWKWWFARLCATAVWG